ncbi:MAG: T9SS type A sorting domain-containing protein, partial [Chitinophagales bacterium]|nr:T9SS type A sorting domain-containing protein [Chitinophagales bacterium]
DNENLDFSIVNKGYLNSKSAALFLPDTLRYTGKISLASPVLDISSTPGATLKFRYFFSQKKLNNIDALEVFFSSDCGKTWTGVLKKSGQNFRTVPNVVNNVNQFDSDSTKWGLINIPITGKFQTADFRFKIVLTNYYGNNFLLDDININPELYTGTPTQINEQQAPQIHYCNENKSLIITSKEPYLLSIVDMQGKLLNQNLLNNPYIYNVSNLMAGMYIVEIKTHTLVVIKKFFIPY